MQTRIAACSCGQLRAICSGTAGRISMCHCLACQRRSGAPFGAQSRFQREQVQVEGRSSTYTRRADSGNTVRFHFCPECGSTVYWEPGAFPDKITVALGAFADPSYPAPAHSVWEAMRHPWTQHIADVPMEHLD
ncbi:MAG: GFA family protein [Proteobacteria bacterium]|nr:GFA family protein [Pseudomonadota bacterium]